MPPEPPDPARLEDPTTGFRAGRALAVLAAALAVSLVPIPGLEPRAHRTLVILVIAGGLWMTESLPVEARLAPGVYVIRLAQAGMTRTSRGVVTR